MAGKRKVCGEIPENNTEQPRRSTRIKNKMLSNGIPADNIEQPRRSPRIKNKMLPEGIFCERRRSPIRLKNRRLSSEGTHNEDDVKKPRRSLRIKSMKPEKIPEYFVHKGQSSRRKPKKKLSKGTPKNINKQANQTLRNKPRKLSGGTPKDGIEQPYRYLSLSTRFKTKPATPTPNLTGFEQLPQEMRFKIFSYLGVPDMSVLCLTAKSMRTMLEDYQNSINGSKHILPKKDKENTANSWKRQLRRYKQLGRYVKCMGCLYPLSQRLEILEQMLRKLKFIGPEPDQGRHSRNLMKAKHILCCVGEFIHAATTGSSETDFALIYVVLGKVFAIETVLGEAVKNGVAGNPPVEIASREYFRSLILDPKCKQPTEWAFWLKLILEPFTIQQQAKIIYILYGPTNYQENWGFETAVLWMGRHDLEMNDLHQSGLQNVAKCIRTLHYYRDEYDDNRILSLVEKLLETPVSWQLESCAQLLNLCGHKISEMYLMSKIVKGDCFVASNLISYMIMVYNWDQLSIQPVTNIMESICGKINQVQCTALFISLPETLHLLTMELHDVAKTGEFAENDFKNFLLAQKQFTEFIIKKTLSSNWAQKKTAGKSEK